MPDYRFLFYGKPVHQPSVLLRCNCFYLGFIARPAESAVRQAFVKQQKPITFIKKRLNPVSSSSAEEEYTAFISRIQVELMLHSRSKTIDSATQIRIPAGNIYVL